MINSTQQIILCGDVSVEEDTNVLGDMVVRFAVDHREVIVRKLHDNLVKRDHHRFYLKVSGILVLG